MSKPLRSHAAEKKYPVAKLLTTAQHKSSITLLKLGAPGQHRLSTGTTVWKQHTYSSNITATNHTIAQIQAATIVQKPD